MQISGRNFLWLLLVSLFFFNTVNAQVAGQELTLVREPTYISSQSQVVWYDGSWWGVFRRAGAGTEWKVFKYSGSSWSDNVSTGITVGDAVDVHMDESNGILYVLASSSNRLSRLSYSAGNFTLDSGFPKVVSIVPPPAGSQNNPACITRAEDGDIFIFWVGVDTSGNNFMALHSTDQGVTWSSDTIMAIAQASALTDAVSFQYAGDNYVGVFIGEGNKGEFSFLRLIDSGDPATDWVEETMPDISGLGSADDHVNIVKDASNNLYMIGKNGDKDNFFLFKRNNDGSWEDYQIRPTYGTRPALAIDETYSKLFILATVRRTGDSSNKIQYTVLDKDNLTDIIGNGLWVPVLENGADNFNDVTVTYQTLDNTTNLMVAATNTSTNPDSVWYNVLEINTNYAPLLTPIAAQNMNEDDTLDVAVLSADADGNDITLTVNNLPSFGSFTDSGDGTGTISLIAGFDDSGVYSDIEVIATDNGSPSLSDTVLFTLTVNNVNRAPALTSIGAQGMNEGETLDVPVSSTDPDGNGITLSAPNLPSFGALTDNGDGTGTISFTTGFDDAGVYSDIEIIATDNGSPSLSDTVLFTLTVNNVNRNPALTAIGAQGMNEGETLDVNISSTDPDGDNLILTSPNLPSFGTLTDNGDGTGTISFTAGFDDAGVYADIEVIATDNGTPSLADTVTFTLTVNDVNRAPALTPIAAQGMNENDTLDVAVSSTDPDGNSITLSAGNLPTFGTFTDNGDGTGTISFTTGFDDAGVYSNIQVIATDDGIPSLADTVFFTLTVNEVNRSPILTSISAQNMNEGETLDVNISSTDPDGNNLTLTSPNLPSFGSLTDNGDGTGTISFTAGFDDAGVYSNIQVIATDNGSPSLADTVTFTLTVNDVNRAPLLTPIAAQGMNEGETLDVNISSTDPDGDNLTLSAPNLPSFGSLTDNGDGTGTISFTPGFDDAGVYSNIQVIATDNGTPSLADTVTFGLTVNDANRPPVLTPIAAQEMNENETLDVAISSTDPDGNGITLSAPNLPSFGSLTDNGDGTGTISLTPGFDDAGVYSNIQVIATDDGTPSSADTVFFTLTVNEVNRSPILTSISAQNMNEGETLDVNISSTDPDGNSLTLTAPNLPSFGSLTDNGDGTGTISFTPGFDDAGVYSDIEVIATDNGSPSLADTVKFTLTVNDINRAPVLTPIAAQSMNENETLDVAISSTDPDGNGITLSAGNLPTFGTFTDNGDGTGTISFTTGFDDAGVYSKIQVIATDDGTPSLADTTFFTLTVNEVNRSPILTSISAQNMNEGETLDVAVSSTDPDGNSITLSAPNLPSFGNLTDNGDGTGTISFTPGFDDAGVYSNIQVIATDNGSPSLADTVFFTLTVNGVNRSPILTPISAQNMNEGETLDVAVSSTDPDGNTITLSAPNLPSFGNLTDNGDGTGTISFTPGFNNAGIYSNIQVIASDNGSPSLADTVAFTLTVNDVNRAPILTPIAAQGMNENDTLDVAVSSTDPDGNGITLSASNLPSFGSFTDNGDGTGSFSFITDFGDAGSYPDIEVIAVDNGSPSLSDTVTFTLTVDDVNRAPLLTPIASQNANEGDTLDVTVSSTDPDEDSITLMAENLPSFGSFSDNGDGTGSFRFTPGYDNAGSYPNVTVIATDNGNPSLSDTVSFTLTINNVNRAPVLTSISSQSMNEGDTLDVPVSSTDPDGNSITLVASNLPSFGSFTDNGDGTGSFHFATTFGDEGVYPNIQVIASDNGSPSLSDTASFTLSVGNVNRAPIITPIADQNMNEGDTLDVAVSSTDLDGDNITLSANNVPSFGSFTDNGDGTGNLRFITNFNNAGVYQNIEITATDDGSPPLAATESFTLTVHNVNRAPILTSIPAQNMNEGDILVVVVSSTDPDGDDITLIAGNLPSFGTFTNNGDGTGSLRFTPDFTNAGSYPNVRVVATDNGNPALSDTVTFTLTVNNVNRAPALTPINNLVINEGETLIAPASATDPDGDNIILTANNIPSFGVFTDNGDGTGSFAFTPGFDDAGTYPNIELIATDNGSPTLSDTINFDLTVDDVNRPPILASIPPQNMNENDTLDVDVSSTDPDGNSIVLTANNVPPFGNFTDNGDGTGSFHFVTNFGDEGVYPNIQVIATDNGIPSLTDTVTFSLAVGNVNRAPILTEIPAQNMNENDTLDVNVTSTDPDGDDITLTAGNLPSFGSFTDNGDGTGVINFTTNFDDAGVYPNIRITASDNASPSMSDTVLFTLTVNNVNRAPVLTSIPAQNMNEGDTLDVSVSSTDPDGNPISLVANNLPPFGSFTDNGDGTGTINFTPAFGDTGVYPNITVIATDNGSPVLSDTASFTLTVGDVNRAPILTSISAQNMNEGDTLDVGVFSTDPDGDLITLSANNLPPFGTFTDNGDGTGTITFIAGFEDAGVYPNLEVIAADNGNPSMMDTVSFTLTVHNSNRLPLAVDDVDTTLEDTAITINVLVNDTDPDGDTLTVTGITQGNNGTVAISSDSMLTYTPELNFYGTDTFTYFISDGNGGSDTAAVMIAITSVNDLPVIANLPDSVEFNADTSVTLNIWDFVEDVETPDSLLLFQFSANPDSLVFDYDTTTGFLTVSTVSNFTGEVNVSMTVSDTEGGTAEDSIVVTINPVVGIDDPFALLIPKEFVLMQNYPNPFNPVTNIRFGLPVASDVVIEVYNILGQRVMKLLEERKPAGYHVVQFNAGQLGSGLYFYRIKVDNFNEVKKMMLVK